VGLKNWQTHIRTLSAHGGVTAIAISPDGRTVAGGGYRPVKSESEQWQIAPTLRAFEADLLLALAHGKTLPVAAIVGDQTLEFEDW